MHTFFKISVIACCGMLAILENLDQKLKKKRILHLILFIFNASKRKEKNYPSFYAMQLLNINLKLYYHIKVLDSYWSSKHHYKTF